MSLRKWGGGIKSRLELFRKFIRFGGATRPARCKDARMRQGCIEEIFGLQGLKNTIVEKSWDVISVEDNLTTLWKIEQRAVLWWGRIRNRFLKAVVATMWLLPSRQLCEVSYPLTRSTRWTFQSSQIQQGGELKQLEMHQCLKVEEAALQAAIEDAHKFYAEVRPSF